MNAEIKLLELPDLLQVRANCEVLWGIPVLDGAMPPAFITEASIFAVESGRPSLWFSAFAFIMRGPPVIAGSGGFRGAPVDGKVEIGYGVAKAVRNRGLASEAVCQLCSVAFSRADVVEVFGETAVENVASGRVMQKAGFVLVGTRMSQSDGEVHVWRCVRVVPATLPSRSRDWF